MQKESLIAMIDGLLFEHEQAICCDGDKDIDRMATILELWKADLEAGETPPVTGVIRKAVIFGSRHLQRVGSYRGQDNLKNLVDYFLDTVKVKKKPVSLSA